MLKTLKSYVNFLRELDLILIEVDLVERATDHYFKLRQLISES